MSGNEIDDVLDANNCGDGYKIVNNEAEVIFVREELVEENESHGTVAGFDIFQSEIHGMDSKFFIFCLFIVWSFSLVGLFFARFPLAGKIFSWAVIFLGSLHLLWKLFKYLRRKRRNMQYVSV